MTTYNSDLFLKNANRAAHGESREAQHAFGTFAAGVALVAGDIINLVKLPPYARIIGACISADQIDTGGTPTLALTVGDLGVGISTGANYQAPNAARYFTATAVGRAAAPNDANANPTIRGQGQNFYNNQTVPLVVQATVSVAAATFAPGNIYLRVAYFVDEPASLLNQ